MGGPTAFTRPQPLCFNSCPIGRRRSADPVPRHPSSRAAPRTSMAPLTANPEEDLGWHTVKAKYWWRRRPLSTRHDGLQSTNRPSIPLHLFNTRTTGRCFRCLAPNHRSSDCRNPVRCFGCRHYGHRLRDCKPPRGDRAAAPTSMQPVRSAGSQQRAQAASVTMVVLGDPCTRPDEETCIIPTSFDIEQEAKEWESTALVPWAFSLPQGAGVRQVEETILYELRLKRGEVTVSQHSPEAFLIKFEQQKHCEAAHRRRCIKRNGVVLCLRPYRSLEHAIGAHFFYRVRICLEGVPRHAWLPDVVERLVGRSCSMQYIETDLLHPSDTRSINLWAWTRNPCKIPKRIGLIFTNRAVGDASSSWQVMDELPSKWQFGTAFQVLVHLDSMEDYTTAPSPLIGTAIPQFTPARHPFIWYWGKADGEPGPDRVYEHPSPPREAMASNDHGRGAGADAGRRRDRPRNAPRPGVTDDHPKPQLLRRRGGPDDDEEDGPGRHGHRRAVGWPQGSAWTRTRSRSPRRREFGRSSHGGGDGRRHQQLHVPAGFELKLPSLEELRARDNVGLQKMFATEAATLRTDLSHLLEDQVQRPVENLLAPARAWLHDAAVKQQQWLRQADDYITKACHLADRLNIATVPLLPGNRAWSSADTVPVSRAMGRILCAIPAHTSGGDGGPFIDHVDEMVVSMRELEIVTDSVVDVAADSGAAAAAACEVTAGCSKVVGSLVEPASDSEVVELPGSPREHRSTVAATGASQVPLPSPTQAIHGCFFSTPPLPLLKEAPPLPQQRRRRTYDMTKVRRSARLANRPAMPALKRAQIILCQWLGLTAEETNHNSVEQALKKYVAMFNTALPEPVTAALTSLLGIDDEHTEQLDEALIGLVGQGIDGINPMEGVPAAGGAVDE